VPISPELTDARTLSDLATAPRASRRRPHGRAARASLARAPPPPAHRWRGLAPPQGGSYGWDVKTAPPPPTQRARAKPAPPTTCCTPTIAGDCLANGKYTVRIAASGKVSPRARPIVSGKSTQRVRSRKVPHDHRQRWTAHTDRWGGRYGCERLTCRYHARCGEEEIDGRRASVAWPPEVAIAAAEPTAARDARSLYGTVGTDIPVCDEWLSGGAFLSLPKPLISPPPSLRLAVPPARRLLELAA